MEQIKQELLQHGLKATMQRMHLLYYLKHTKAHPSAAMMQKYLQEKQIYMSTATIYNIVLTFLQKGMIRKVCEIDGAAHFDYNTKDHIHIYDTTTGEIADLDNEEAFEGLKKTLAAHAIKPKRMDILLET